MATVSLQPVRQQGLREDHSTEVVHIPEFPEVEGPELAYAIGTPLYIYIYMVL